jgi:hypothetical protein
MGPGLPSPGHCRPYSPNVLEGVFPEVRYLLLRRPYRKMRLAAAASIMPGWGRGRSSGGRTTEKEVTQSMSEGSSYSASQQAMVDL